jgi:transketolase
MLHETLLAAEQLAQRGITVTVVNQPWLNVVDDEWLAQAVRGDAPIFVIEDHGSTGGLGDFLLRALVRQKLLGARPFAIFAVEGLPACGTPAEALAAHGLDGESIARRVTASLARVAC